MTSAWAASFLAMLRDATSRSSHKFIVFLRRTAVGPPPITVSVRSTWAVRDKAARSSYAVILLVSSPLIATIESPGLILPTRLEDVRTRETTVPSESLLSKKAMPSFPRGAVKLCVVVFGAASRSRHASIGIHIDAPNSTECKSKFGATDACASADNRDAEARCDLDRRVDDWSGSKMSSNPITVLTKSFPDLASRAEPIPT